MDKQNKEVKLSLNPEELNFILNYQLADKLQFKKLLAIKKELLIKRPNFKRANIILTLDDIENLLENTTREINKKDNSTDNQYLLRCVWTKLATKYNLISHKEQPYN